MDRVGYIEIRYGELRELLGLPEDAIIRDVSRRAGDMHNVIQVKVEHPDLPESPEGWVLSPFRIRRETRRLPSGEVLKNVPVDGWPLYPNDEPKGRFVPKVR